MVIIMGIIFYLSHLPGDIIQMPQVIGLDKAAHLIAYSILAAAFLFAIQPFLHHSNRTAFAIAAILFCILFGVGDEFHQSFIPGRSVSVWDVVADCLGGLLVAVIWLKRSGTMLL